MIELTAEEIDLICSWGWVCMDKANWGEEDKKLYTKLINEVHRIYG